MDYLRFINYLLQCSLVANMMVTNGRANGHLMGHCLLQNELCSIALNLHVVKAILCRSIRFRDLAFFHRVVYESFRFGNGR